MRTIKLGNNWIAIADSPLWECLQVELRRLCPSTGEVLQTCIVPYGPVFDLVAEHVRELKQEELDDASAIKVLGIQK